MLGGGIVGLATAASLAVTEMMAFAGSRRLGRSDWRVGVREWLCSTSIERRADSAAELVPSLRPADLLRGPTGIRAQAVDSRGRLLDDFHIIEGSPSIHVLNAPSPAATAALSIGRTIARRVEVRLANWEAFRHGT